MSGLINRLLRLSAALILAAGSTVCLSVDGTGSGAQGTPAAQPSAASESMPAADQPRADESPEQARRRELTAQHGAEVADAILAGTVLKEMTMEQVLLARGAPSRKELIPPEIELWHYATGEVAFSGGKVSYVSLAAKTEPPPADPRHEVITEEENAPDHSAEELPGQVGAPPITVGDSYVYESTNPADPESGVSTRRTVTSTKGRVTLSSLNLDNKRAKPRSLYFDRQWNLIASRSPDIKRQGLFSALEVLRLSAVSRKDLESDLHRDRPQDWGDPDPYDFGYRRGVGTGLRACRDLQCHQGPSGHRALRPEYRRANPRHRYVLVRPRGAAQRQIRDDRQGRQPGAHPVAVV